MNNNELRHYLLNYDRFDFDSMVDIITYHNNGYDWETREILNNYFNESITLSECITRIGL